MADNFSADPDKVQAVAQQLADIGAQMNGILTSLNSKLAGEGQPWGDDSTGKQFADGSNGYTAQSQSILAAFQQDVQIVQTYAETLSQMMTAVQQQDSG